MSLVSLAETGLLEGEAAYTSPITAAQNLYHACNTSFSSSSSGPAKDKNDQNNLVSHQQTSTSTSSSRFCFEKQEDEDEEDEEDEPSTPDSISSSEIFDTLDMELGLLPSQIETVLAHVYAERYAEGDDHSEGKKNRMSRRLWDDMLRREREAEMSGEMETELKERARNGDMNSEKEVLHAGLDLTEVVGVGVDEVDAAACTDAVSLWMDGLDEATAEIPEYWYDANVSVEVGSKGVPFSSTQKVAKLST